MGKSAGCVFQPALARYAADIQCKRRTFNFRYPSTDHWIDVFRNYDGPVHKAHACRASLSALWALAFGGRLV